MTSTPSQHKTLWLDAVQVPKVVDCLQPIINIVPLQLLSYHLTVLRGFNVDQPQEPGEVGDCHGRLSERQATIKERLARVQRERLQDRSGAGRY